MEVPPSALLATVFTCAQSEAAPALAWRSTCRSTTKRSLFCSESVFQERRALPSPVAVASKAASSTGSGVPEPVAVHRLNEAIPLRATTLLEGTATPPAMLYVCPPSSERHSSSVPSLSPFSSDSS